MTTLRLAAHVTACIALLGVAAVGIPSALPPALPRMPAIVLGLLVGGLLFTVVARESIPLSRLRRERRVSVLARSAYLTLRAAGEEVVWRACVLGALLAVTSAPAALGTSTAGFALSHWRAQKQLAAVHLLTGATFGVLFYATGRVGAAIAAHATYNVLVGLGVETSRSRPRPGVTRTLP